MKQISGITAAAVLALSGLGIAAQSFHTAAPAATITYPSESETRVERCMASGGVEETCIYEEMKRTMLVNQS